MAAAFDQVDALNLGSVTSASWTHTPVGTPTLVIVSLMSAATGAVTTATYGGQNLTEATGSPAGGGSVPTVHMWYLASPPAGAQTVSLIWTTATRAVRCSMTYTGTTGTHVGTVVSTTGTNIASISVDVTSSASGMVMDAAAIHNDASITVGADQTQRHNVNYGASGEHSGGGSTEPGAATVTMSWTGLDSSNQCTIMAIPILGEFLASPAKMRWHRRTRIPGLVTVYE